MGEAGRCGTGGCSPFVLLRRDRQMIPRAGIQESGDLDFSFTSLLTSNVALGRSLSFFGPPLRKVLISGAQLKAGRPCFYVKSY